MNNVVENIEYLVRRHDCVVIPSWGAFIANYQSSYYDESKRLFYPPARDLSFNPNVDHNDGLLTSSISRRLRVPFSKAAKIVEAEVSSMKHQLEDEGEVSLGNVGRFIRQAESTMIFEPSEKISGYESRCLCPISVVPLRAKVVEAESVADENADCGTIVVGLKRRMILRTIKVAASISVLIGVGTLFSESLFSNRNDNFASVSTGAIHRQHQEAAMPAAAEVFEADERQSADGDAEGVEAEISTDAAIPTHGDVAAANEADGRSAAADRYIVEHPVKKSADETVLSDAKGEAVATTTPTAEYCLVIASLASQQQAELYISQEGNPDLKILVKDGRYRVYIASGNTPEEVSSFKKERNIAKRYPNAWVCNMK